MADVPDKDQDYPKLPSVAAKKPEGIGALVLAQVPHLSDGTDGITNGALASTNKIIGIALHPRALGMAAWTSFANDEFAGVLLGKCKYPTSPIR